MIFGFGEHGHTNLLTRALADVGQSCDLCRSRTLNYLPDGLTMQVDRFDGFIDRMAAQFHEAKGIRAFYDTCWQMFVVLRCRCCPGSPAYLAKVFFRARWPASVWPDGCRSTSESGASARSDEELLRLIDMEVLLVSDACRSHTDDQCRHGVLRSSCRSITRKEASERSLRNSLTASVMAVRFAIARE